MISQEEMNSLFLKYVTSFVTDNSIINIEFNGSAIHYRRLHTYDGRRTVWMRKAEGEGIEITEGEIQKFSDERTIDIHFYDRNKITGFKRDRGRLFLNQENIEYAYDPKTGLFLRERRCEISAYDHIILRNQIERENNTSTTEKLEQRL
jgi:hypothetical protein